MYRYTCYRWCLTAKAIVSKDITYRCWSGNSTCYCIAIATYCDSRRYCWSAYPYYCYRYSCRCATVTAVSSLAQVVTHCISAAWRACWNHYITCTWVNAWGCCTCWRSGMYCYTCYRCCLTTDTIVSKDITYCCWSGNSTCYGVAIATYCDSRCYCWRSYYKG